MIKCIVNNVEKDIARIPMFVNNIEKTGWEIRDGQDRLIWCLNRTLTGTSSIQFKGYGMDLIDYGSKGNASLSGIPYPNAPIYPQECGNMSENLMTPSPAESKTLNGVTITSDGNGYYSASGTSTDSGTIYFDIEPFIIPTSVGQGGTGTVSFFNNRSLGSNVKLVFYTDTTTIDSWALNSSNRKSNSYAALGNKPLTRIGIQFVSGISFSDFSFSPVFTNNSTYPASFIQHNYSITITSTTGSMTFVSTEPFRKIGDVTDDISYVNGGLIRYIKRIVLSGNESGWSQVSNTTAPLRLSLPDFIPPSGSTQATEIRWMCSHYQALSNGSSWGSYNSCVSFSTTDTSPSIRFRDTSVSNNLANFLAFLQSQYNSGTPVMLWYVATTRFEPFNMQAISTIEGANSYTIGNTSLAPSSSYITGHIKQQ